MSLRLALSNSLKHTSKQVLRQATASYATPILAISASRSARLFSSSTFVANKHVAEVAESLKNELEHEAENYEAFPEEFESFLSSSGFAIEDNSGSALAKLAKNGPNEVVNVFFDVNQVANVQASQEPEEGLSEEETQAAYEDAMDNSYINLNVVIEKKSDSSAVAFDVLIGPEDGATFIESVTTYKNIAEALTETSEAEHQRELAYNGPAFSNLDEALQVNLENYLSSRGVNEELYQFVLNYGLYKENVEYNSWLKNLAAFFKK